MFLQPQLLQPPLNPLQYPMQTQMQSPQPTRTSIALSALFAAGQSAAASLPAMPTPQSISHQNVQAAKTPVPADRRTQQAQGPVADQPRPHSAATKSGSSAPSVRNAAQQPAANGSADNGRPSTVVPVGILGGPPTLLAPARAVPNPSPQYPPQQAAPPKASAANGVKGQSSGQGQGRGAQKKGGNAKGGGNVGGGAANSAVMLGQLFGAAAGMPAKSLPPMPPMPHGTNSISLAELEKSLKR